MIAVKRPLVCVQGLGYVGAAMAICVASVKGVDDEPLFDVVGMDLATEKGNYRVDELNNGRFPFKTLDKSLINNAKKCISQGNLYATTDASVLKNVDIVVVDVQLDIRVLSGNKYDADLAPLEAAVTTLGRFLKKGALVVVETTVPPGCCEQFIRKILSDASLSRGLDSGDIMLAHSYERVMPGKNYLKSIQNYWRVYAGENQQSSKSCRIFLEKIINVKKYKLRELSSTTASETAKIIENSYRAVNIAFMEEWSSFAEELGLDMFEIIDAIKDRPSHSNIMQPGLGVGGYCLTKDPHMGKVSLKKFFELPALDFPISEMGVHVNQEMAPKNANRMLQFLGNVENKEVLVMGVAYKSDVDDTRNSPVISIFNALSSVGANITLHDPLVTYWEELDLYIDSRLPDFDNFYSIILAVPHEQYLSIDIVSMVKTAKPLIFDCCNMISYSAKAELRANGCRVRTIGNGS